MHTSLLATRIRIPPVRGHDVSRPRLTDALNRGVLTHPLTLLAAPAGYGKTTLLRQWAETAPVPVAWLAIEEVDNDRVGFLRCLVAAWTPVWPEIAESPLGLLLGSSDPDPDSALTACLDLGSGRREPVVIVLDDYHLITDPAIHRDVAFLLDHLPDQVHVVIAGRDEPPLPLARLRARQQVVEIRLDELRFRPDEVAAFLSMARGLDLPSDTVVAINDQLEGWAAGLQLYALTVPTAGMANAPPRITGRHRLIADYLRAEVLDRLPDRQRRFLLRVSVLERLSGSLCDAVHGAAGSQEMLEELERANLFLMPLDDEREWFRCHALFRELLCDELGRRYPDEVADLHRRAARWYLAHDLSEPAVHHAIAAGDIGLARAAFERFATENINSGAVRTVQTWLDRLPAGWEEREPSFGLARAGCLMAAGAFAQGVRRIDDVEAQLRATAGDDREERLARVHAVRCFVACAQNDLAAAVSRADLALRDLPGDDLAFRVGVHLALGDSFRRNGRWEEARDVYLKVLEIDRGRMARVRAVRAYGALADLDLRRGRLRDAGRRWRQALDAMEDQEAWGRLPLDVSGWVFLRYAELLYEWDDLAGARRYLDRGLARAELGGDALCLIAGHVIAARLGLTEGDIAGASAHLEEVRPLVEQSSFPDWTSRFDRLQVELWLRDGQHRMAVAWVDDMLLSEEFGHRPENQPARLALVRVCIAQGEAAGDPQARIVLADLLTEAETEGRTGITIEALALRAMLEWRRGESAHSMMALERALRLAEPEGYLRLFADLGLPMARLLQEARSRGVLPDYAGRILAAFHQHAGMPDPAMPETLSERERDVLRLVSAGLTNREVADALFISPETVKKHTLAIYGKLGVANRTEAAARARALDLLNEYP